LILPESNESDESHDSRQLNDSESLDRTILSALGAIKLRLTGS